MLKFKNMLLFAPDGSESGKTDEEVLDKTNEEEEQPDKTEQQDYSSGEDVLSALEKGDTDFDKMKDSLFKSDKTEEEPSEDKTEDEPSRKAGGKPKYVRVDDKYLENIPEEERGYYNAIKGESLSPKAIDIHINAQKLIKQQKEKLEQPEQKEDFDFKPKEEKQQPEEADKLKSEWTSSILKRKFNDFPQTKGDWEDLHIDDPEKWYRYMRERERAEEQVTQEYGKMQKLQENHGKINQGEISEAVSQVTKDLEDMGLKPDDLEIELSDESGKLSPIVKQAIQENPQIIFNRYGMSFVDRTALYNHLVKSVLPKASERLKTIARGEGFTAKKSVTPPPSQSAATDKGTAGKTRLSFQQKLENAKSDEDFDKLKEEIAKKF